MFELIDFIRESNRIEGIHRDPTDCEWEATKAFLKLQEPKIADLEAFVAAIAPGHRLRDQYGLNVRVGDHVAPAGCPEIRQSLNTILGRACGGEDAWRVHLDYEALHPFTDGNGRSGRLLWLWQMGDAPIGFLHQFYYQTLSNIRR